MENKREDGIGAGRSEGALFGPEFERALVPGEIKRRVEGMLSGLEEDKKNGRETDFSNTALEDMFLLAYPENQEKLTYRKKLRLNQFKSMDYYYWTQSDFEKYFEILLSNEKIKIFIEELRSKYNEMDKPGDELLSK